MNLCIHRLLCLLAVCGVTSLSAPCLGLAQDAASSSEKFTVKTNDEGVAIMLDDELIAQYWKQHTAKPIIWPLIGAGGNEITRGYPMREASETERSDHVHHRSMWFTHGEVNGFDFWAEGRDNCGTIVPAGPAAATGGSTATLAAAHDWLGPDGKRVLSDRWELTFAGDGDRRWIDCVFYLIASDGDVHFGDTKEGSFGLRLAGTMKVDAEQGGEIVNAEGLKNGEAWGKPSSWVDYHGPVEGDVEGVAIMNHPESFGYPCRWHVRTYGLFAANPFGESHFTGQKAKTDGKTLAAGDTWRLVYRVYLHTGDTEEGGVAEAWEEYRKKPLEKE